MSYNHEPDAPLTTEELFEGAQARASAQVSTAVHRVSASDAVEREELERLSTALTRYRDEGDSAPALGEAETKAMLRRACDELPRLPRHRWHLVVSVAALALAALAVSALLLRESPVRGELVPVQVYASLERQPRLTLAEKGTISAARDRPLTLTVGKTMRLSLRPRARLRLRHGRDKQKTVSLKRGAAVVEVHGRAPDEQVRVETPLGTVHVTGTIFTVVVQPRRTQVGVSEGRTRFVSHDGRVTVVSAGQQLSITDDVLELGPLRPSNRKRIAAALRSHDRPRDEKPPAATRDATLPATPRAAAVPGAQTPAARPRPSRAPAEEVDALYRRAELSMARGQHDKAEAQLEQLTRLFSGHPTARQALFELAHLRELQLGDHARAAETYCRYAALGPAAPLRYEAKQALSRLGWSQRDIEACR